MTSKRRWWLGGAAAVALMVVVPAMAAGHKAKPAGGGAAKAAAGHARTVSGIVDAIAGDSITIRPAGKAGGKAAPKAGGAKAPAGPVTLGLNADTQYAAADKGSTDDVAVGSLAAAILSDGDNPEVKAILVYKSDAAGAADALTASVPALRRLAAGKDRARPATAPVPVIGKITAVADGSVTIEGKDKTVTAKLGEAPVGKLTAKTHDDIQVGSTVAATLVAAVGKNDPKVASAIVQLPAPATKANGKGAKNAEHGAPPAANPPVIQ